MTNERINTWNKIGTDISEAANINEALQISGLNYQVEKSNIYLPNGYEIPGKYATKISGTDKVFGIVGDDYEIVQNSEAFSFVDGIIPEGLKFVKAGETKAMNYIIAEMPERYILDDKFTPYIIFQNSHQGYCTVKAAICALRIVCQNQFTTAFKNAENAVSLRHSSSVHDKLVEAQQVLSFQSTYMDTFTKQAEEMALKKFSNYQVENILNQLFKVPEDATMRKLNKIEENRDLFLTAYNADDNFNFRGTAWGLVNAFADYNTHRSVKNTETADINKFVDVTLEPRKMDRFISLVLNAA